MPLRTQIPFENIDNACNSYTTYKTFSSKIFDFIYFQKEIIQGESSNLQDIIAQCTPGTYVTSMI
jgi:hypothetical protein